MQWNTVIFDMDGLLIDSEPLWQEAADRVFRDYGLHLSPQLYSTTTGLRTREFVDHWFRYFKFSGADAQDAEQKIIAHVVELIRQKGRPMPGVAHIINFFLGKQFKIGMATSSGRAVIDEAVRLLGIGGHLQFIASAEGLPYGKPHPQVYLDCAAGLGSHPSSCICFEDSFNGMIAAKAARMKCIIVPSPHDAQRPAWGAADLRISSLQNFNELLLQSL